MNSVPYYDLKQEILQKIKKNGGWVNAHAHIDRAYTITKENFKEANRFRHEKWKLNTDLRKNSTVDQIYDRMAAATEHLIAQGVTVNGSFIDVDPYVKDKAIKAAQKLRDRYKSQITIKYINQASYGIFDKEAREWFEIGTDFVDIIGGLLKSSEGNEEKYLDIILQTAKEKKKMVHVHVDELNDPEETETEMLARKTIQYKMKGQVVGVHGISINAHPKDYREKVYQLIQESGLVIVACPMSWLDSWRKEALAPVHNPIAPVDEMVKHDIPVAIGIDNIADIFLPLNSGEIWEDLKALIYENRLYDLDEIVKIATVNGRKALGIS